MDEAEQRQLARDSLFVMADLRLDGSDEEHRIKVRNLSSGGMMGEGSVRVKRGAMLQVHIRNIGWVEGSIAWVRMIALESPFEKISTQRLHVRRLYRVSIRRGLRGRPCPIMAVQA